MMNSSLKEEEIKKLGNRALFRFYKGIEKLLVIRTRLNTLEITK